MYWAQTNHIIYIYNTLYCGQFRESGFLFVNVNKYLSCTHIQRLFDHLAQFPIKTDTKFTCKSIFRFVFIKSLVLNSVLHRMHPLCSITAQPNRWPNQQAFQNETNRKCEWRDYFMSILVYCLFVRWSCLCSDCIATTKVVQ